MTPSRKRTFLIIALVIVVLIIAGVIYGVTEYNRKPAVIAEQDVQVTVNAADLFAAFETNEQEANAKYLNKIIAVTGPVGDVTSDQNNRRLVMLRTPEMMFGVACSMVDSETDKAGKLTPGQQVTIKGLCTGYTMDVVIMDGTLVD